MQQQPVKAEGTKYQDFFLGLITEKKWRMLRHLLLLVPLAITTYPEVDRALLETAKIPNPELFVAALRKGMLLMFIIAVFIIYFNIFVLIPRLLFKNKFLYYFICCLTIAMVYFISEHNIAAWYMRDYKQYMPEIANWSVKGFVDSVFTPLVFLAATTGYKVFKKWMIDNKLLSEMKQAKIEEELANLKNQINPHFLFNTLNNLNTLISTDTAKASAVVLGLSDVLRYHLYEADAEKVLLKKDIEILKQLLELEKLRRDDFQFSINTEGTLTGVMVPPFTFINFIDNAIKHSADNRNFSFITLEFKITGSTLVFSCKNSIPPVAVVSKAGGIGLQNIKRRLELMYGNAFTLDIANEQNTYTVTLTLPV
jgi:sensor histidine kinase YesM